MISRKHVKFIFFVLAIAGLLTGFVYSKRLASVFLDSVCGRIKTSHLSDFSYICMKNQTNGLRAPALKATVAADAGVHYSYFSQKQFYEEAYNGAGPQLYQPAAKAILVNHHLLAGSFIAEAFNTIATAAPVTVLLISPNHFSAGNNLAITSAETWKTLYGDLFADGDAVKKLADSQLVGVEESVFDQEHGISGIVGFVKKSLPSAKLVPIVFNNRMPLTQALKLADEYSNILPENTLIVGSFDFSHYLTSNAADFHDVENLAAVKNFDFNSIYNLDIDSRPGLAFFLRLLKNNKAEKFTMLKHSNSAKLTHKDILETTSYITGYFLPGFLSAPSSSPDTLLFLGKITPSSAILSALHKTDKTFALTFMERLFYGQDSVLAFLPEGDFSAVEVKKILASQFKIQIPEGGKITKQLGELKVALINCSTQVPNEARAAIDQGSLAVICQGAGENRLELYKNKPIIFVAGNFLDEKSVLNGKKNVAIGLAYQEHILQIFLLPIGAESGQLKLLVEGESGKVLIEMASNSPVSEKLQDQIKSGEIIINNIK